MNCVLLVQTDCCTNNCQTEGKHDDIEEHEEEQTDEEDIDSLSIKTKMG